MNNCLLELIEALDVSVGVLMCQKIEKVGCYIVPIYILNADALQDGRSGSLALAKLTQLEVCLQDSQEALHMLTLAERYAITLITRLALSLPRKVLNTHCQA